MQLHRWSIVPNLVRVCMNLTILTLVISQSAKFQLINVPGRNDSGPKHWQSIWETDFAGVCRVSQLNWSSPTRDAWVHALDQTVQIQSRPVILIAHSLGCNTIVHWANTSENAAKCAGALLVAPGDVDMHASGGEIMTFVPTPLRRLPFVSTLVASTNDPLVAFERAQLFAMAWGSTLVNVGAVGHVNAESNLGDWPQGKALLAQLIESAQQHDEL